MKREAKRTLPKNEKNPIADSVGANLGLRRPPTRLPPPSLALLPIILSFRVLVQRYCH